MPREDTLLYGNCDYYYDYDSDSDNDEKGLTGPIEPFYIFRLTDYHLQLPGKICLHPRAPPHPHRPLYEWTGLSGARPPCWT